MKHLLWLFLLIPLICYGADSKITDLTDVGASSDDVMYVVDNPGTTSASDNKITLGNLLLFFATQDMTLTGTIDASGATVTWPATITTTTFAGALTGNADTATNIANKGADFTDDSSAPTSTRYVIGYGTTTAYRWTIASLLGLSGWTATPEGTCFLGFNTTWGCQTSIPSVSIGGGTASTVAVWDGSQNLTALSSQNVVTTGLISGLMPTVVYSADGALNVSQAQARANTFFVNTYAGTQVMTLPAAEAGMAVCIRNGQNNSRVIQVHSDGTDYLVVPSTGLRNTAANHFAATASPANQICLVAVDTTDWYITSTVGTWTEE